MYVWAVKESTDFSQVWAVLIFFHARGRSSKSVWSSYPYRSCFVFEQGHFKLYPDMLHYMVHKEENSVRMADFQGRRLLGGRA